MSAARLREAATEIREDWADPQTHRNAAAASFYFAVADWLEHTASDIDVNVGPDGRIRGSWDSRMPFNVRRANAVADAYLGGTR